MFYRAVVYGMSGIRFSSGRDLVRLTLDKKPVRFCMNATIAEAPRFLFTAKHVRVALAPDVRRWIETIEGEFYESRLVDPHRGFYEVGDFLELKINSKTRFFDDNAPCSSAAAVPGRVARLDVEWVGISTRHDRYRHLFVAHLVVLA